MVPIRSSVVLCDNYYFSAIRVNVKKRRAQQNSFAMPFAEQYAVYQLFIERRFSMKINEVNLYSGQNSGLLNR
jgi:hypothetical protein